MEVFRCKTSCVLLLMFFANWCSCYGPEQGIFTIELDGNNRFGVVSKNLAEDTEIAITVNCTGLGSFKIDWKMRFTECNEVTPENITAVESFFMEGWEKYPFVVNYEDYVFVQESLNTEDMSCKPSSHLLKDETDAYTNGTCYSAYPKDKEHCKYFGPTDPPPTTAAPAKPDKGTEKKPDSKVKRRAADDGASKKGGAVKSKSNAETEVKPAKNKAATPKADPTKPTKTATTQKPPEPLKGRVTKITRPGQWWLLVHLQPLSASEKQDKLEVTLTVKMKSPSGYLSASQAPLLIFYAVMCGVYSILTFIWLVMLALQWRDLLRIQFWIGGVMLLGLLEKAVFYAEYENINNTGFSMSGAIIFAELVSCSKRSLARMLVIIVSLGYGITRPRLGRDLHWVLGAGGLYLILSSVEACLRVKGSDQHALIAILPLAVLDAIICWWIFKSLVDTTRTLRLRRNMVKLWLYRHFTNTLIFAVVAAVIFLLWSTKTHRWTECVKKWHELWLDDAYWHVLFCVILIVIVILFRPTANNQRYAYSPLTDRDADDESQEPMMNDAFEGMKMRNVVTNRNESQSSHKTDDDLKWVEDNIPAAVADAALGAFDDSEEELVANLERNKME